MKNKAHILLLTLVLLLSPALLLKAATYYVSATSGSDTNVGTNPAQPCLTIQHAAGVAATSSTIYVSTGTYTETVTPANNDIVFTPNSGNTGPVVISGADAVSSSSWSLSSGSIYKETAVNDTVGSVSSEPFSSTVSELEEPQVFVNGVAIQYSRWPATSYSDPSHPNNEVSSNLPVYQLNGTQDNCTVTDTQINSAYAVAGAVIHINIGSAWWSQTGTVTGYNSTSHILSFNLPSLEPAGSAEIGSVEDAANFGPAPAKANGYYLTDVPSMSVTSAVTQAGTWYYTGSTLYVWAPNSDNLTNTDQVLVKHRLYAFDLRGKTGTKIYNMNLFGATVLSDSSTSWTILSGLIVSYPSHFVKSVVDRDHRIDNGIMLYGSNNSIVDSSIGYSAGSGVLLDGSTNTCSDCIIHDCDYSGSDNGCVTVLGTSNIMNQNTMYNSGRDLIYHSGAKDSIIEYNDLSGAMLQTADGGALYTGWTDNAITDGTATTYTNVSYNTIHDIQSGLYTTPPSSTNRFRYGIGVYMDNEGANINVHHNLIWNIAGEAVQVNNTNTTSTSGTIVNNNTIWSDGAAFNFEQAKTGTYPEIQATNSLYFNHNLYNTSESSNSGGYVVYVKGWPSASNGTYGNNLAGANEGIFTSVVISGSPVSSPQVALPEAYFITNANPVFSQVGTSPDTAAGAYASASPGFGLGTEPAFSSATGAVGMVTATPTLSPNGGSFGPGSENVTLSTTTPFATIYYTLDGSTPTTSSTVYSSPVNISSSLTIKAYATAQGLFDSAVGSASFTYEGQVATPTFSPNGGSFGPGSENVTISSTTSGAAIYYTLDGSTPTTSSTLYSSPVSISSSLTINALATKSGMFNSAVGTSAAFVYTASLGAWTSNDLGGPGIAGSATIDSTGNTYTVQGGGNIHSTADAFHYLYQPLTGDGTIVAEVTQTDDNNEWTKAGVMFRDTTGTGAMMAMMALYPTSTDGAVFQYRTSTNGTMASNAEDPGPGAPEWVKLVRAGNVFTGYYGADGQNWTVQGATTTVPMGSAALVGLSVTAENNAELDSSTFSNVSVSPAWTPQDIGTPGIAGSSAFSDLTSVYTLIGGGLIKNQVDAFQYDYQVVTGDCSIIARVASTEDLNEWTQAGVMIRETTDQSATFAMVGLYPTSTDGVMMKYRLTSSATAGANSEVPGFAAPCYVKMTRVGNVFTGYYSTDGSTWTAQGPSQTITMQSSVLIGLAVTAQNNGQSDTSTFDHVSFVP